MKTRIYLILLALIMTACSEEDLKEVAEDKKEDETIDITVDLTDFSAAIAENPSNGQKIGTIGGTTSEGSIIYSMVSQSPDAAFDLDQATGELTVSDSSLFDFETRTSLTAKISGANGEVMDSATVTITVTDVVEIISVQEKLDEGLTPLEIYEEDNTLLDELYGKTYQGGIIFYFDKTTGSGIVAAPTDQSSSTSWGCNIFNLGYNVQPPGFPFTVFECVAESQAIGKGQANTDEILNYCSGTSAAKICDQLSIDTYDDWYLPSADELLQFVTNIPQDTGSGYWSSSQRCRDNGGSAAMAVYADTTKLSILKSNGKRVRAVRSFEEPASSGRR